MALATSFEWDEAAWRLDTEMLSQEARGIYRDILGHLYLQKDRSGVVTGTREELARAGRCSALQADLTIKELAKYNVADVQERNGIVTLINRRLHKHSKRRENGRKRVENHRSGNHTHPAPRTTKHPCNAPGNATVTPSPHTPLSKTDKEKTDKALSPLSPLSERGTGKTKTGGARLCRALNAPRAALALRYEIILGHQWPNDAGKWVNRIKDPKTFGKSERVAAEVESALKENRVDTTPAQYAEQIWKEFK